MRLPCFGRLIEIIRRVIAGKILRAGIILEVFGVPQKGKVFVILKMIDEGVVK